MPNSAEIEANEAVLIVKPALDTNQYTTEIKVSDEEPAALRLERHEVHGDWNYAISPCLKQTRPQEIVKVISAQALPHAVDHLTSNPALGGVRSQMPD